MKKKINLTLLQVQNIQDERIRNSWTEVIQSGGTIKVEVNVKDEICKKKHLSQSLLRAKPGCDWYQYWCNN